MKVHLRTAESTWTYSAQLTPTACGLVVAKAPIADDWRSVSCASCKRSREWKSLWDARTKDAS